MIKYKMTLLSRILYVYERIMCFHYFMVIYTESSDNKVASKLQSEVNS